MECPFCDIISKKADANIVYESEHVIAFLDIDPINEGHVLIIPKIHESSIENISICILNEVLEVAQKIVGALKKVYDADGYSIMQNGGAFCDFGHAHFHVFPRYENDGFGWKYPEGTFDSSKKVAKLICNAMN